MRIVGVTMVKDEADVIEFTIRNLFRQGVDKVLVNDNMSSDATPDILAELASEFDIEVSLDTEVGYYQSDKMTALARRAFDEHGATTVIPFDADEYWTGIGQPLSEALNNSPYHVTSIPLYNYFGVDGDGDDPNPFVRITHRDKSKAPLYKVAVRDMPKLVIHQGNHSAAGRGSQGKIQTAMIGHFPWRSYEQFERKVVNGAAAYRATNLPEEQGIHWRGYGDAYDSGGREALEEIYDKWFRNPELETVERPVWQEYQ